MDPNQDSEPEVLCRVTSLRLNLPALQMLHSSLTQLPRKSADPAIQPPLRYFLYILCQATTSHLPSRRQRPVHNIQVLLRSATLPNFVHNDKKEKLEPRQWKAVVQSQKCWVPCMPVLIFPWLVNGR